MKLLFITNGINGPGGLERVLAIKTAHLIEKHGFEITILGLNQGNENPFFEFSDKINFININIGNSNRPLKYINLYKKGVQRAVDEIQPDLISVCDNGIKAFLLPLFLKTKAKLIYERHNSRVAQIKSSGKRQILKTRAQLFLTEILAPRYDHFVILTEDQKVEWQNAPNLSVIPNPLSFQSEQKSVLDQKIVLCVGGISYQKGQDILLKIWEEIQHEFPEWQLHLYGENNQNEIDINNLPAQVKYFPSDKNIQEKYLQSSVYAMSSRYEGFGMVLVEAMACGVPCVSFACPFGPSDIISHGEDGFLAENGNHEELKSYLIKLMKDVELRIEMGAKAYLNVKRFDPDFIMKQWTDLYQKLSS